VRAEPVGNHVAVAFAQRYVFAAFQLTHKRSVQTMHNVSFLAPVVGHIPGGVFHQAYSKPAVMHTLPIGGAGVARVCCFFNSCPVDGLKGNVAHGNFAVLINAGLPPEM